MEYGVNTVSKRVSDLNVSPQFDGYSRVEVIVDENTSYSAGDDTGRTLTINNPWGTQEQADNILAAIQGFRYQPYTATGALLDPAAELGDGVTLYGVYSGIYKLSRSYSPLMAADISAPQDEEIDHEYPYESKADRDINRKFTAIESEFVLQSNLISAKVSETGGDNSSFGWELQSDHFSLYSGGTEVFKVDSSGATVKGVITATSGKIGGFDIGDSSIYKDIEDFGNSGQKTSGVYIGTDGIRLGKNFSVDSGGNITANNATLTGTLKIGGKTISAANLQSGAAAGYSWSNGSYGGYTSQAAYALGGAAAGIGAKGTLDSLTAGNLAVSYLKANNVWANLSFVFKNKQVTWKTINIDGTNYSVLGYQYGNTI